MATFLSASDRFIGTSPVELQHAKAMPQEKSRTLSVQWFYFERHPAHFTPMVDLSRLNGLVAGQLVDFFGRRIPFEPREKALAGFADPHF